ncbi:MAG TPA: peptidoglycan DD-metalloendopeptidase family protein [Planctomycetota bacterium]|jgi:murein DD-endopeptidase MepM/ murein hydrolase activator NlpD|nr:peptidoglycan DD-metalloendopeptidase family protein [Planctomycetota bacterium]
MKHLLLAAALLAQEHSGEESLKRFKETTAKIQTAFNERKADSIRELFDDRMRLELPLPKLQQFLTELFESVGKWSGTGAMTLRADAALFTATFERGSLNVALTLDGQGRISGLLFTPLRPALPTPERNTVKLGLPVKDTWSVFWGGDTKMLNYHVVDEPQRRAFDLVVVDSNGSTHRGDGTKNEDYLAWGREIVAPADGVIAEAIDGVRDNEPGKMNPYATIGNALIIVHAKDEVSLLAHFKRGSVRPKAGDRVRRGDVLGLCGNSGNSSEPHLHYHLMNSATMPEAIGIKVFFERVRVSREGTTQIREDYSPIKGDRISPVAPGEEK